MLTKAGKQVLAVALNTTGLNNAQNNATMFPNDSIKDISNNTKWVSWHGGTFLSSASFTKNKAHGIIIGSGNTAPTENDYFLESQITSGIDGVITDTCRGRDGNGKMYMEFTIIISNTGASDLTIKEIGAVTYGTRCKSSASATSVSQANLLVDRTLLDSPLTIAPNKSGLITYRITSDIAMS